MGSLGFMGPLGEPYTQCAHLRVTAAPCGHRVAVSRKEGEKAVSFFSSHCPLLCTRNHAGILGLLPQKSACSPQSTVILWPGKYRQPFLLSGPTLDSYTDCLEKAPSTERWVSVGSVEATITALGLRTCSGHRQPCPQGPCPWKVKATEP